MERLHNWVFLQFGSINTIGCLLSLDLVSSGVAGELSCGY